MHELNESNVRHRPVCILDTLTPVRIPFQSAKSIKNQSLYSNNKTYRYFYGNRFKKYHCLCIG